MLNLASRRCVIVGGGDVAARRGRALIDAGAVVTVIAPSLDDATAVLPCRVLQREYGEGDLHDAFLVVIATDNEAVNERIAMHARAAGVLTNRADKPDEGDLIIPAHTHHGAVTIAVDTAGSSPAAAAKIRRQLSAAMDPDWPLLLELIAPFRGRAQASIADNESRRRVLRALTDDAMIQRLKESGSSAVLAACEQLLENAKAPTVAND